LGSYFDELFRSHFCMLVVAAPLFEYLALMLILCRRSKGNLSGANSKVAWQTWYVLNIPLFLTCDWWLVWAFLCQLLCLTCCIGISVLLFAHMRSWDD